MRPLIPGAAAALLLLAAAARGQELPLVAGVEPQPVLAQALRLDEALSFLGSSLAPEDSHRLRELAAAAHTPRTVAEVQAVLDRYCLAMVHINPESRVKAVRGPAHAELVQEGWSSFLVKVHNEAGVTARLEADSPNAQPILSHSTNAPRPDPARGISDGEIANRFLELLVYRRRPLAPALSGLKLEYAVLQIYTRAVGKREARIGFHVGQGTQDIGFRGTLDVLFDCRPSVRTVFRVLDHDGTPAMASFTITDEVTRADGGAGRRLIEAYPLPSRRLARDDEYPDFFFHAQVYRQDGEHVFLAPGDYHVKFTRGPEYVPQTRSITVPEGVETHEVEFRLRRWIHMAALGWYSVDHHVHAAGCSHYDTPAQGVEPEHMWRQALGEDLNVSSVLSWGPCWYHQKDFFEGRVHALSTERNLMRFDVEVSGFPSSHAGHVCLLRLKEDDYPGAETIEEWPSWTLPVLKWARRQGGVVGYAHSGLGLEPLEPTRELPNFVMAQFDGIGANEYIVTVTHDAVDFISAGDTPAQWELNIWYHTLNCGYRTRISGETDFPCLSDERVGMARSYVRLPGKLDFDACVEQIRNGRSYVSEGASHLIDFTVEGAELGTGGSEVRLSAPGQVAVKARVAARLDERRRDGLPALPEWSTDAEQWRAFLLRRPFWDLEKARIGDTRKVPVELVVNGVGVARREIVADGGWNDVAFEWPVDASSWMALRILPSSHTNPIFVLVDGAPIRASVESAEWCRAAVDRCWDMKSGLIRPEELDAATEGYEHARRAYDRIIEEARAR